MGLFGGKGSDGKPTGGLGLSPLGIIQGVGDTIGGLAQGIGMGGFDYGQQGYTVKDAGNYAQQRASSMLSGIPLAGGLLGGIFGTLAQKIAEKKAAPIVENRDAKMDQIAQYQMDKLKQNAFLQDKVNGIFNQWG